MASYTQGTVASFSHSFLDPQTGDPLVPVDSNYPQVQINDPSGVILASGVGSSTTTPGSWSFDYTIPADADTCTGYSITWTLVDLQHDSHEKTYEFGVAALIETQDELDRTGTYLTMLDQTERLVYRVADEPDDIQVTMTMADGTEVLSKANTQLSTHISDCYHNYYVDTPQLTCEGHYLVTWRIRKTPASSYDYAVQNLIVPPQMFWFLIGDLRNLIDKLNKRTTTPLSYLPIELYRAYDNGLDLINTVHPLTSWGWSDLPGVLHAYWTIAAGIWALNSRQLLEIEVSHNLCLTGGSLVATPDGLRPLREVVADARVCPHCEERSNKLEKQEGLVDGEVTVLRGDGTYAETTATYRKRKVEVHRLVTEHGFRLTGQNHRVLSIGPEMRVEWVPLTELTVDHWVAIPREEADSVELAVGFNLDELMEGRGVRTVPPPKIPTMLTPELGKVMGHLVAEGVCNYKHYFSFSNADPRLHAEFQECVSAVFGLNAIDDRNERTACYNTCYSSVVARDALARLGLDYSKAPKKKVPWSVFQAPLRVARAFLQAFYDGDGDTDELRMTSSSKKLLRGIQRLLTRFGVVSKLGPHSSPGAWRLSVPAGHQQAYADRVGFGEKQPPVAEPRSSHLWCIPYGPNLLKRVKDHRRGNAYETQEGATTQPGWALDELHADALSPLKLKELLGAHKDDLTAIDPDVAETLAVLNQFHWSRVKSVRPAGEKTVYDLKLSQGAGLLNHSYQANGLVVHNSGQTVTLDYDHASPLSEVISRFETMLREWVTAAKFTLYRQSAGPGAVAVRPYRLRYYNRVYKVGTSAQPVQDFPGLLNRLGLMV